MFFRATINDFHKRDGDVRHSNKCDSPSVLNHEGININGIANYSLQITLNGEDINGPEQLFMYYKSPIITNVNPMLGPIEGGNNINITGFDFNQPGACNVNREICHVSN